MSSVIYAWKGTNYLSKNSTDNLKNLLSNPKIYLRFNGFELNNIQEIERFLTFNDNSREKTVRESINCYKPEKKGNRTPKVQLETDKFQGIVPSFHLDENTISILNDYSGTVGLPKSVMIFITSQDSYEIASQSDTDLDTKVSNFSEGTIKANCPYVDTDLTETLITPNFNGVIIYLNFNNEEYQNSNFSILGYISREIDYKQKDRDYKNLKKNIIISTILASELEIEDKIKLLTPINQFLAKELDIQYKSYLQRQRESDENKSKSKRERKSDDELESQSKAQRSYGGKKTKKGKKIYKTKKIKSIYRLNKKSIYRLNKKSIYRLNKKSIKKIKKVKKVNKKTKNYKKVRK